MIIGVFGLPRSGKTYWSAWTIYNNYIKKGVKVYSNIPLKGAFKVTMSDILQGFPVSRGAVLFLDEIQNYANSREWDKLSDFLYFLFSQGGKMDLKLYYSAQDSSRVDKTLREVTNYYYEVSKLIPDDPNKPSIDMKKAPLLKRILLIDRYSNNYDYSFKKNGSRSFCYIRQWFLDYFDSFYFVGKREVINNNVKEFEKWNI
jgi:hypothetical protein